MPKYIALLRGINVSGQKLIKMDALKAAFEKEGFGKVKTYIQSGNVVFEHKSKDADALAAQIVALIAKHFQFDVPVIIRDLAQMKAVVANNPFAADMETLSKKVYVGFLEAAPNPTQIAGLKPYTAEGEIAIVIGKEIWLCYHNGAGNAKLTNAQVERRLETKCTSRNWNTTTKLLEMLRE